ncbi:MAG: phosphate acyltransferase PlsX [Sphingobacteriales bacterium]|nr:phosphate acyltransferase PlsX [Sphingobacteriales bacterium]
MRIGLDIMGGDYAPNATVLGAIAAQKHLKEQQHLVLFGNKNQIVPILKEQNFNPDLFEYVETTEVIGMGEHPTKAIVQKPNSSISLGFQFLKEGKIDSFASAGNTGAMLVGSLFSVKAIEGVTRPAVSAIIPKVKGGFGMMVDAGANADCKPENLVQFAIMGSLYAKYVYNIETPKVGMMNLGEEEEKGNLLTQASYPLLKGNSNINFIGNIEGRDLFNDKADVIVCDGFTGNVLLKLAESFYVLTLKKGLKDEFFDRFNYEQYGGSPVLGVNAPVIIGHGISSPEAIKNMILLSKDMVETKIIERFKTAFNS